MTEEKAELRAAFNRQRRSLIAISMALVLVYGGGLELRTIQVLGAQFGIKRPVVLTLGLWASWLYFLVRYYQHHKELSETSFATLWRSRYREALDQVAMSKVTRRVEKEHVRPGESVSISAKGIQGNVYAFRATVIGRDQMPRVVPDPVTVKLGVLARIGLAARTGNFLAIKTRRFTEFALPYAIAGAPVLLFLADCARALP